MSRNFIVFAAASTALLLTGCTKKANDLVFQTPAGYSLPVPMASLAGPADTRTWEEKAEAADRIAEIEAENEKQSAVAPTDTKTTAVQAPAPQPLKTHKKIAKHKTAKKKISKRAKRSRSRLALK